MSRRAVGLVAEEQNVMPFIAQHGLDVIDNANPAAHAPPAMTMAERAVCQMFDDAFVVTVAVYCNQLFERQRATPGLGAPMDF